MSKDFSIVFAEAFTKKQKTFNWKHAHERMNAFSSYFYDILSSKETFPSKEEFDKYLQETMVQTYVKKQGKQKKKPVSHFFAFCQDKRAQVKAENPDAKVTEITSMLGAMWRNLSDEEKQPYHAPREPIVKEEQPKKAEKVDVKKPIKAKKEKIVLPTKEEDMAFTLSLINKYLEHLDSFVEPE